jgi:hypothetical protein
MGLLHFLQIGGGGFFGMTRTWAGRALPNSLSPEIAETGAVMNSFARLHHGESMRQNRSLR